MNTSIEVENIRCGGCANSITKKLTAIEGVKSVDVEIENQIVMVDVSDDAVREAVVKSLKNMGYPETGSVEGLEAMKGKAKSVVSCAIGKIT
ncbi:MAG: heavy-metal-associated domain-containing protein [Cocleimonas sp.]|nr:heavy-metal-associated domain-containing protein [Cocleimonas sp.]